MSRIIIIFILVICALSNSYAQKNNIDELSDRLFFNIFIHQPDSAVYGFIKRYFPAFSEKPVKGGWTMYADVAIPIYDTSIHSIFFTKHPYFESKFRKGRLDLFSLENNDSRPGIFDLQIWFFFDNEMDGKIAFKALCDSFQTVSTHQKIFTRGNKKYAHFSDEREMPYEIILIPDEIYDGQFKMIFHFWPFEERNK